MDNNFDSTPLPSLTLCDALYALTAVHQETVLVDYGNVIFRRDYQTVDKVRLLSGGLAGTDLSHAFFVGRGMLTGAILGEDSVPSSRQILHAIKELNEGDNFGILVIVQANSDLFNFGLGVQRANADCRTRVKLLVIDDDRSENKERYSCGFILLTKVLGAMAERGLFFDEIYDCYRNLAPHIVTVPLAYTAGARKATQISFTNFDSQVQGVIDTKSQMDLVLHPSIPTVALLNFSKHLERITELGLIRQVIERLRQLAVCLVRIYYGNFFSVAQRTASLTVLKVFDKKIINYLDDHCDAAGWLDLKQFLPEVTLKHEIRGRLCQRGKQEIPLKGCKLDEHQSTVLRKAVQFACDALISCEQQLNIIDSEKSDGNVGTRFKKLAQHLNRKLNNKLLPAHCPYAFLIKLGIMAESAISGTMGSIYGIFFEKAATVFEEIPESDYIMPVFIWAKALTVGSQAIRALCGPEQMETTMCYPIRCCEIATNEEKEKYDNWIHCYGMGVSMAEQAAEKTRTPPNKYPDAGAHAVGIWMRAVFEAVKLMGIGCGSAEIE